MTKWPAPIIRLYLGQMESDAVLGAADDSTASVKIGHVCEANFYTGELALMQGRTHDASQLFETAVTHCPTDYDERFAAGAELKALGAPR